MIEPKMKARLRAISSPATTEVLPVVAPTPSPSGAAATTTPIAVVSGVATPDGGQAVAGVQVEFQPFDCNGCPRYRAATDVTGSYVLRLPQGHYRAGCVAARMMAGCLRRASCGDVTLDMPTDRVDVTVAIFTAGRNGVVQMSPFWEIAGAVCAHRPRVFTPRFS
jgi:hypothetical protein